MQKKSLLTCIDAATMPNHPKRQNINVSEVQGAAQSDVIYQPIPVRVQGVTKVVLKLNKMDISLGKSSHRSKRASSISS